MDNQDLSNPTLSFPCPFIGYSRAGKISCSWPDLLQRQVRIGGMAWLFYGFLSTRSCLSASSAVTVLCLCTTLRMKTLSRRCGSCFFFFCYVFFPPFFCLMYTNMHAIHDSLPLNSCLALGQELGEGAQAHARK